MTIDGIDIYPKLTSSGTKDFRYLQGDSKILANQKFTYEVSKKFKMNKGFDFKFDNINMTISIKLSKESNLIIIVDGANVKFK